MKFHVSGYFLSNWKIHGDGTFDADMDLYIDNPHDDREVEEKIIQELSESLVIEWKEG